MMGKKKFADILKENSTKINTPVKKEKLQTELTETEKELIFGLRLDSISDIINLHEADANREARLAIKDAKEANNDAINAREKVAKTGQGGIEAAKASNLANDTYRLAKDAQIRASQENRKEKDSLTGETIKEGATDGINRQIEAARLRKENLIDRNNKAEERAQESIERLEDRKRRITAATADEKSTEETAASLQEELDEINNFLNSIKK